MSDYQPSDSAFDRALRAAYEKSKQFLNIKTPERPLFNRVYEEARSVVGAPYDISDSRRLESAKKITTDFNELFHDGNRAIVPFNGGIFEYSEKIRRQAIGGYRKFVPGHLQISNLQEINDLEQVVSGASHYRTSNPFKLDNPVTGMFYGSLAGLSWEIANNQDMLESPEQLLQSLLPVSPEVKVGLTLGFAAGSAGMVYFRNRIKKVREDAENARIWDATQFLDMIYYFVRQGPLVLSNIRGREYPVPLYQNVSDHKSFGYFESTRESAIKNLKSNPFITRMGVKVVDEANRGNLKFNTSTERDKPRLANKETAREALSQEDLGLHIF